MNIGHMVSFQIIVHVHLPVAIQLILDASKKRLRLEPRRSNSFQNAFKTNVQSDIRRREPHKNQASPRIYFDRNESEVFAVKQFHSIEMRNASQRTIQQISPSMILTL